MLCVCSCRTTRKAYLHLHLHVLLRERLPISCICATNPQYSAVLAALLIVECGRRFGEISRCEPRMSPKCGGSGFPPGGYLPAPAFPIHTPISFQFFHLLDLRSCVRFTRVCEHWFSAMSSDEAMTRQTGPPSMESGADVRPAKRHRITVACSCCRQRKTRVSLV